MIPPFRSSSHRRPCHRFPPATPLLPLLLALLVTLSGLAPSAGAAEPQELAALLERYAAAIVPVEAVVRTEMQMGGQGQDDESEVDLVGAVVDPGGLIMVWNSHISSARMSEMMRLLGRDAGDFDFDMTPLSFDVRLPGPSGATGGGSEETVKAFLAASDPQLDLAFLQLSEPPAEPLPFFDMSGGAEATADLAVGDELFAVNRLTVQFASAPFLGTARVVGELSKPRRAWILGGDLVSFGLPLVTADGHVAGVLSTVVSSVEAERAASQMASGMAGAMAGGNGKTSGPIGAFALPADTVARAVARSLDRARQMVAEGAVPTATDAEAESEDDEAAEDDTAEEDAAEETEEGEGEEGAAEDDGAGEPEDG